MDSSNNQEPLVKTSVNLFESDLEAIRKEAETLERDPSWIIRKAIRKYVSEEQRA